jgi:hypothetical protein
MRCGGWELSALALALVGFFGFALSERLLVSCSGDQELPFEPPFDWYAEKDIVGWSMKGEALEQGDPENGARTRQVPGHSRVF